MILKIFVESSNLSPPKTQPTHHHAAPRDENSPSKTLFPYNSYSSITASKMLAYMGCILILSFARLIKGGYYSCLLPKDTSFLRVSKGIYEYICLQNHEFQSTKL